MTLASVAVAVVAAALLGTAGVAQRRAALGVPTFGAGDPRLIRALIRRPWWWVGTVASVAGLGLQVLALTLGSIIVVQCALTSSIVFTTVAERLLLGRRPPARAWLGTGLIALGLIGLLVALSPMVAVTASPPTAATVAVAVGCLAMMAAAVVRSRRHSGEIGLAAATGLGYGVTAVQLKTVGTQLALGAGSLLTHPALYLAAALGPLSILLSQHALQRGRHALAVVSVILMTDPLVGLLAGLLWFGERVSTSADALTGAALGVAVLVLGMGLVQSRSVPTTEPADDRAPRRGELVRSG